MSAIPEGVEEAARGPIARLLASLGNLLASLLTIGRTRIELLTVELQLELQRLSVLLAWGFAALFAAAASLVMIGIAVIVAFWDSHRALAATLVAAAYVGAAVIAGIVLARKIRTKPRMLEGTLRELARDSERLRGGRG